jgi:hypothetical protein
MSTIWGRFGQELAGQVPDPDRAVAQDDELADVVGAAAAGLGHDQGPELGRGGEGGQVAGRAGIPYREPVLVQFGLGEQARELDLTGAGPPVVRQRAALAIRAAGLAGPVRGLFRGHRHTGPVDRDVEDVRHRRWW